MTATTATDMTKLDRPVHRLEDFLESYGTYNSRPPPSPLPRPLSHKSRRRQVEETSRTSLHDIKKYVLKTVEVHINAKA